MSDSGVGFVGRVRRRALSTDAAPERVIAAVGARDGAVVLDSAGVGGRAGRYTVIGIEPIDSIEVQDTTGPDPFARLEAQLRENPIEPGDSEGPPYSGGWVGWLGYEAGAWIENVPVSTPPATELPVVRLDLFDTLLAFDHLEGRWYGTGIEWAGGSQYVRPPIEARWEAAERFLDSAGDHDEEVHDASPAELRAVITRAEYEARVRRAIEYIAAGDVYQVNFTQQFLVRWPGRAIELYQRLRRLNPGAYSACLAWGDQGVLSSSPELFLQVDGRQVVTRPIKGTRPRIGDPIVDAARREALLASEKDHAELAMIVDLERNDLGRVCEFGSVRVVEPFVLEEHPTVYHLVATVAGRMRADCGPVDLLRATFPGGSITGAPKIRSMEIIDELESHQRGPYCGSTGYIGLDGSMRLNIAIRTILLDAGQAIIPVGGGIVADSDPADEYEETLAKARGMLAALNASEAGMVRSGERQR